MVKRALVLSGGGAKGIFEVGCLRRLLEMEAMLDFDFFLGVSAGALNASFLAQAPMTDGCGGPASLRALRTQVAALEDLWRTIDSPSDIYRGDPEPSAVTMAEVALGKDSLLDATPIRRLIDQHIFTQRARTSGRKLHIGATSLISGEYVAFDLDQPGLDLPRAVKASAAVPAMFTPVRYGHDLLVDGAIRNNTPLSRAFAARPSLEIVVIQTSPLGGHVLPEAFDMDGSGPLSGGKSALDVLARSARIMAEEVQKDDLAGAGQWSRVVTLMERVAGEVPAAIAAEIRRELALLDRVAVPIRVYAPSQHLLRNELVFKKVQMDQMYAAGCKAAESPVL
jgi:NTE family protein